MDATKLKELRIAKKITQKQLAEKIGTEQSRISDWENGKFKISKSYQKLLQILLN